MSAPPLTVALAKGKVFDGALRRLSEAGYGVPPGLSDSSRRLVVDSLDEVDALVREIESGERGVPVLLRQYLKLNAKVLGLNLDPDFGNAIDALVLTDLTSVDRRIMDLYMGREGADAFLAAGPGR